MKDVKNELLKRREVMVIVEAKSNPGFVQASKIICDQFKAVEDRVVIKRVGGKFGRDTFLIDAMIYDSVENKKNIEPKPKLKKGVEGQPVVSVGGVK